MPFDSTPQQPVVFADEIAIIDKMQYILGSPARWVQGFQFFRIEGSQDRYCLIGALRLAQSDDGKMVGKYTEAGNHVAKVMRRLSGGSVSGFNDTNRYPDVMRLLRAVRTHFENV